MKKLIAKVKKIKKTPWGKLTRGEKVAMVIMDLIKIAAIAAIVISVVGIAAVIILGVVVGFGIMNAVAGGFYDAADAYRPGDRYVHFR